MFSRNDFRFLFCLVGFGRFRGVVFGGCFGIFEMVFRTVFEVVWEGYLDHV